jgi:hypothetical protein
MTIFTAYFFISAGVFKRKRQIGFIEGIQKVDKLMKDELKIFIDNSMFRLSSLITLIVTILYYYVIVSIVMIFYLLDINTIHGFFSLIVYISLSATSGIFTFCFVSYVTLINMRIVKLNQKLAGIMRYPPEILVRIYKTKDALYEEMLRYSKGYKVLCTCVDDLNTIYGSSMVLHFAHDFTLLTTQIFAMLYIGLNPTQDFMTERIIALMIWTFPNLVKISTICFACHMTTNEVSRKYF